MPLSACSGHAQEPRVTRRCSGNYKENEELELAKTETASKEKESALTRWCLPGLERELCFLLSHGRKEK